MIENRLPMEATGGADSRKLGQAPLLSPRRQILMEEEVITPPQGGGGGIRPLSLRVHHVGYEQYLILFLKISHRTVGMMVWIVRRILDRRSIC